MNNPVNAPLNTFTATLTFKDHLEHFVANRVKLQEIIIQSGTFWVIKGFEDTVNPETQSTEINTLQFYMSKTDRPGMLNLVPPKVLPEIAPNSAGYYKLEDSPDDEDNEVDAAYEFPCTQGKIFFAPFLTPQRLGAIYDFNVKAPNLETFNIKGVFDVTGPFVPTDLR